MNLYARILRQFLAALLIGALSAVTVAAHPADDKMKPEELIAKHLASIGSAEALAAAKSRVLIGTTTARLLLTTAPIELNGPVQFASDGNKVLLAMIFNSNNYSYEKAAFDGQDLTVGVLQSGRRSVLSDFFFAHEAIFKQGLIGGTLSSAWPLLNPNPKSLKVSYAGTKKLNDRTVHELKFRNAGNIQVSLFFDSETFQHVRTEYRYNVPAQMGATPEESGRQKESIYRLTEEFGDFKKENNLTLPHSYKLTLVIELPERSQTLEYQMNFSQFVFNQPLEAAQFKLK